MNKLLASAPTLEAISEAVTRFYAGEVKTLDQVSPIEWRVCFPDGVPLLGVVIRKRGKRFRFEMI